MPTDQELRETFKAAMDRYYRLGGNGEDIAQRHSLEVIVAYREAMYARNDLVDRGVLCDRCEGDIVDGRCASCGEKAQVTV